jgi:hypothetical protein
MQPPGRPIRLKIFPSQGYGCLCSVTNAINKEATPRGNDLGIGHIMASRTHEHMHATILSGQPWAVAELYDCSTLSFVPLALGYLIFTSHKYTGTQHATTRSSLKLDRLNNCTL